MDALGSTKFAHRRSSFSPHCSAHVKPLDNWVFVLLLDVLLTSSSNIRPQIPSRMRGMYFSDDDAVLQLASVDGVVARVVGRAISKFMAKRTPRFLNQLLKVDPRAIVGIKEQLGERLQLGRAVPSVATMN
ncbi:hypothetical protein PsorP6_014620 [Peronosclerospora sorghi]|uniref:Uncharacterized protein n=1 Tax=Peronosclerospora sorghi TaxID=230839 RepID=A0ACC0VTX3_9STRA|nr:hypothetical protein PsorP6_014620 [Peronosclerospora sorghi]